MSNLTRKSKHTGFAGMFLIHGSIICACLFMASQANTTLLPPPVEAIEFTLTEPVAAPAPVAEATPPPVQEPEPEPEQAPPSPVEEVPVLKQVPPKPKAEKPKPKVPKRVETTLPAPMSPTAPSAAVEAERQAAARTAAVARQTLLSALIARIEKEKRYPNAARKLGLEGTVTVLVQVDASGRILSVRAKQGAAHSLLEKATMETLNKVQEKWTPVAVPEAMTFSIPIRYDLKNS